MFSFIMKVVKCCFKELFSCVLWDRLLPPDLTVVFTLLLKSLDLICGTSDVQLYGQLQLSRCCALMV